MDIKLQKWGNNIGVCIPPHVAERLGIDEYSIVELLEFDNALMIRKKPTASSLDELLSTIPDDFQYPDDICDFAESNAQGKELL